MQLADALHQHRAPGFFLGSDEQVHVVRHQAVRMQPAASPRQYSAQMKQVESSVLMLEETRPTIVAALDDMNRGPRQHDASTSWHAEFNDVTGLPLTENVVCP
jgi:hypothetical protein